MTNTTITDSNVTNSTVDNSTVIDSNVTDSNFTDSNVTNTTITDSNVTNSTVVNSTVTDSNITGSNVTNSTVDNSTVTGSNVTDSNVTNSTVIDSNVTNTNLTNSTVNNCILTNVIMINSSCTDSNKTNAIIINSVNVDCSVTDSNETSMTCDGSNLTSCDVTDFDLIASSCNLETLVGDSSLGISITSPANSSSSTSGAVVQIVTSVTNSTAIENVTIDVDGTLLAIVDNGTHYLANYTGATGSRTVTAAVNNSLSQTESDVIVITVTAPTGGGGGSGGAAQAPGSCDQSSCRWSSCINNIETYSCSDSLCDDGQTRSCVDIECITNYDCGGPDYGANSCSGNNVVRDVSNICVAGQCVAGDTETVESCGTEICSAGSCVECTSSGQCAGSEQCVDNSCQIVVGVPIGIAAGAEGGSLGGVGGEHVQTDVVCYESSSVVSYEVAESKIKIPGRTLLTDSFNLGCSSDEVTLNVVVPRGFADHKLHTCIGNECSPYKVETVDELICSNGDVTTLERSDKTYDPNIEVVGGEVLVRNVSDISIEDLASVDFIGLDEELEARIRAVDSPLAQPANPSITIVGTPVILDLVGSEASITLKYSDIDTIEESGIQIYALVDSQWQYVGGKVDTKENTVSVESNNLGDFAVNGEVTLATIAPLCINCVDASLDLVYSAQSSVALVMIHGFDSTPENFQPLINDYSVTAQPVDIFTYGYPHNRTIDDNSKEFSDLLESRLSTYDSIILIGHSLGGIIAQKAIFDSDARDLKYVDSVKEVILLGSPNKGVDYLDEAGPLLSTLANVKSLQRIYSLDSQSLQDLQTLDEIPTVKGVNYRVVVGSKPLDISVGPITTTSDSLLGLTEANDGIVRVSDARSVGGSILNSECRDFWELNITHTELNDDSDARSIIHSIVDRYVVLSANSLSDVEFVQITIPSCDSRATYVVSGLEDDGYVAPDKYGCELGFFDTVGDLRLGDSGKVSLPVGVAIKDLWALIRDLVEALAVVAAGLATIYLIIREIRSMFVEEHSNVDVHLDDIDSEIHKMMKELEK